MLGMAVPDDVPVRVARQRHEVFELRRGAPAVKAPRVAARDFEDARPAVVLLRDAAVLSELGDVADVVRRGGVVRAVDADHHVAEVLASRAGAAELERGGVRRVLGLLARCWGVVVVVAVANRPAVVAVGLL